MTPADLSALWDAARATLDNNADVIVLALARSGHQNRDMILADLMSEEYGPISAAQREAIGKLAAALKEGGTT